MINERNKIHEQDNQIKKLTKELLIKDELNEKIKETRQKIIINIILTILVIILSIYVNTILPIILFKLISILGICLSITNIKKIQISFKNLKQDIKKHEILSINSRYNNEIIMIKRKEKESLENKKTEETYISSKNDNVNCKKRKLILRKEYKKC